MVVFKYRGIQLKLSEKVVNRQSRFEDNEELKELEVIMKIVKKYLLHLLFEQQTSILGRE